MAADRPQLGDTPAGRKYKDMPKPKAKAKPQPSAGAAVKKLIKDVATGGGYNATLPPWQDNIRGK